MADYCKVRFLVTYSENSDYSDPLVEADWSAEYRPDEIIQRKVEAVINAGGGEHTAITATDLDDPLIALAVRNRDDTNFVTLTYTEGAAGTDVVDIKIPAGAMVMVTDVDSTAAIKLTADTATCVCDAILIGD